jgi:CheY-like chemotaxis protein
MGGGTVLLAEDDLDVRDVLQDALERAGYEVIPASHGRQAIEYLSTTERPPDMVLTDLVMPLASGWQVLARMATDPVLARTPVVVLTATTGDRPDGATVVFRKPFDLDRLLDTIEQILELRREEEHEATAQP